MSSFNSNVFRKAIWQPDRMLLDDLVFRLEHKKSDAWDGGEHFRFFKVKELVDQYEHCLTRLPGFSPKRILELGIFDGGSVAYWHELFRPEQHIALDSLDRTDSPYFQRYAAERRLADRIRTHWATNQADKPRLRSIMAEFDGPVDLVIDDASHLYGPTLATFETVFPLLPPGAVYLIEDWAWGHWPEYNTAQHPWARERPLTELVIKLVEAVGTSNQYVANVTVYGGFTAIERGVMQATEPDDFKLENIIVRRPPNAEAVAGKRTLPSRLLTKLGIH